MGHLGQVVLVDVEVGHGELVHAGTRHELGKGGHEGVAGLGGVGLFAHDFTDGVEFRGQQRADLLVVGVGDEQQGRAVRHVGEEPAEGLRDDVVGGGAHEGLREPAQDIRGVGDVAAGFEVRAVLGDDGQVLGDLFDGVDGEKLGEAVLVAVVHVAFGSVEQRVEALEQGQLVRQGEHQLWVDNGNGGEDLVEREVELFVGFLIGHNGIGVGFGARPGGGGDRHHGERAGNRLAPAASGGGVIPQVAGVGHHDGGGLGGVDAAAAAEPDHEVAAAFLGERGGRHDAGAGRVGGDFVEHGHGHAVLSEQFDHALLDAELFHELVFSDAQEGLLAGQGKGGEFLQAARAEDDPGGDEIVDALHHGFVLRIRFGVFRGVAPCSHALSVSNNGAKLLSVQIAYLFSQSPVCPLKASVAEHAEPAAKRYTFHKERPNCSVLGQRDAEERGEKPF